MKESSRCISLREFFEISILGKFTFTLLVIAQLFAISFLLESRNEYVQLVFWIIVTLYSSAVIHIFLGKNHGNKALTVASVCILSFFTNIDFVGEDSIAAGRSSFLLILTSAWIIFLLPWLLPLDVVPIKASRKKAPIVKPSGSLMVWIKNKGKETLL